MEVMLICNSSVDGANDSKRARDGFSNTKIDLKGPDSESPLRRLQESICSLPPVVFVVFPHSNPDCSSLKQLILIMHVVNVMHLNFTMFILDFKEFV